MKISDSPIYLAGLRLTGMALLAAAVGSGSAGAETYEFGGSTATIEQRGGGTSTSEVTRYRDGHKIITRNGNSTDITIQGSGDSSVYDFDRGPSESRADRFDRESIAELFSRVYPDGRDSGDCPECRSSNMREAFKQRMLERMGSRFSP